MNDRIPPDHQAPRGRTAGRSRWIALTAIAGLLAVSGCNGEEASTGKDAAAGYDPKAPVTITWWTGQADDMQKVSEELANEYHTLHPNVTIKVATGASTTDELLTKLSAGFTSGTYPDISYAYGSWAGQLAESGKTQDIAAFVRDPATRWDEFPEAARATVTVDGKVIGMPAVVDNLGVLYNKKLFADAKLPEPTDSWSWDDFRAAAKKLTNPANNTYGTAYSVAGTEDTTWHLWPLLWQKGGKIMDGKKPAFNSDAGVASLDLLRQMAVEDKSMYLDQTDEKYIPLFYDGHVGMIISGPWVLSDLKEHELDYGVAYLPAFNGDHQTVAGVDLWALFDHKDANRAGASRDFVRWLTSKEIDPRWGMANGNLPLRVSEKDTSAFAKYVEEYPGARKFFDNLANCKQPRPTLAGYVELSRHVGEAIAKVLQGAAPTKNALDEAAKKSTEALKG